MVSRYNNQNPQLYYGTLINTLLGYDADIIIGAAPECQWGSLGENPLAGVVTEAPIDFLLFVLPEYTTFSSLSDERGPQRPVLQQRKVQLHERQL